MNPKGWLWNTQEGAEIVGEWPPCQSWMVVWEVGWLPQPPPSRLWTRNSPPPRSPSPPTPTAGSSKTPVPRHQPQVCVTFSRNEGWRQLKSIKVMFPVSSSVSPPSSDLSSADTSLPKMDSGFSQVGRSIKQNGRCEVWRSIRVWVGQNITNMRPSAEDRWWVCPQTTVTYCRHDSTGFDETNINENWFWRVLVNISLVFYTQVGLFIQLSISSWQNLQLCKFPINNIESHWRVGVGKKAIRYFPKHFKF